MFLFELLKWDFTPFFIGFDLNTLSNSLLLPPLYEATLILQSIGHAHFYNLSNTQGITSLYLISYASWLL